MPDIKKLIDYNAQWADERLRDDPEFFSNLSHKQTPDYLWIGCSDSRVPANQVTGLLPGEIFVHRNIGNIVNPSDPNCQSVLQYAIEELKVKHIIVCGHYGCGGVAKALSEDESTPCSDTVSGWLSQIKQINKDYSTILSHLSLEDRVARVCELNVLHQAKNVVKSQAFRRACEKGQSIQVHSWIYDIHTGKISVLDRYYSENPAHV